MVVTGGKKKVKFMFWWEILTGFVINLAELVSNAAVRADLSYAKWPTHITLLGQYTKIFLI